LSQPAEGLAFEARLAGETRLFERTTGCRVKITRRGGRRDIPQPIEDLLIDTALEWLRNAVKYAQARAAMMHLAYQDDAVTLVLQANGSRSCAETRLPDNPPTSQAVRLGPSSSHT